MPKYSAGILAYRIGAPQIEVLLVHPGGPIWTKRDVGAWSIPKGEYVPDQESDPLVVAEREFFEELGVPAPRGKREELGEVKQRGGKRVLAWSLRCDLDVSVVRSNQFEMEWPPNSEKRASFPEIDRAAWFPEDIARTKIVSGQVPFIDRLVAHLLQEESP